jgi:hypothetical protein
MDETAASGVPLLELIQPGANRLGPAKPRAIAWNGAGG